MADGLEEDMSSGPEVVVMGRLSADIYPAQIRTPLREQRNYVRYVGGFAGNVSTGLARDKSRSAHIATLERHPHTTIFDLDYRPSFWSGADAYRRAVRAALPRADIVVGNEDEVRAATGAEDPRAGIATLRALGPRVVILKRGGEGATLFDGDRAIEVPPVRMEVVNGLGAGDAFLASVTHGLLRGINLETAVRRANWAGAYVASQVPCSEAMPYLGDVNAAVLSAS